jgi:hypothetical protein
MLPRQLLRQQQLTQPLLRPRLCHEEVLCRMQCQPLRHQQLMYHAPCHLPCQLLRRRRLLC